MGSPAIEVPWPSSMIESFDESFNVQIDEGNSSATFYHLQHTKSSATQTDNIPVPPPVPNKLCRKVNRGLVNSCSVPRETKDIWDKLFKEGYGADVHIIDENGSIIPAHLYVLTIASPVLGNLLQQSKVNNGVKYIKIPGVPYDGLYVFIRFLYSYSYEEEEMKKFVLHLLVLSHSYVVPSLKRVCEQILEQGWLTKENVVDVLQLARNCDAPRLVMVCLRMVVRDFKCISHTEGWKVMRRVDPSLEQEILESVVEEDSRKQERLKKIEEKKVYLQLYEAMEALLHICRDGCRTIGPRDKALKESQVSCGFKACKGLETLIRHFSACKTRVPGGCVHCKRMWQLLELHSCMCDEPDLCKVPLCGHFKMKMKMQRESKKDEATWKLLVSKVIATKNAQKLLSSRRSNF